MIGSIILRKRKRRNVTKVTKEGSRESTKNFQAEVSRIAKKSVWDKLEKIKIKNKKKVIDAFLKIIKEVQANAYNFQDGETKQKDFVIVHETNRMNSFFVHVVPKELYKIFKTLQKKEPHSFLGFSILAGKIGERDVRVSCFGISSTELTNAMLSQK